MEDKYKKIYESIENNKRLCPVGQLALQDSEGKEFILRCGKTVELSRVFFDSIILEILESASGKSSLLAILDHYLKNNNFDSWRKENNLSWSDVKDSLLWANSEIGHKIKSGKSLNEHCIKWLKQWFDEVSEENKAQDCEIFSDKSIKPVTPYNIGALYDFFIDEGVFASKEGENSYIEEDTFSGCIEKADIKIMRDKTSSFNYLKLFLFLLDKHFYRTQETYSDWYLKVCASVGLHKRDMSRYNVPRIKRDSLERKMIRKVKK